MLGLAGCVGTTAGVSVVAVGTVPGHSPFDHGVEVVRSALDADRPPRIRVGLTNTSDSPVWNTTVRIPAFGGFITRRGPEGHRLVLLDPEGAYETTDPDCWRVDLDRFELNRAYTNAVGDRRYDPGETVSTTFEVYGHPENDEPCLAAGEYPTDIGYYLSEDDRTETTEWEYRWGFRIAVER